MPVFVGLKWVRLFPLWSATAFIARKQKFTTMCRSRLLTFQFLFAGFHTSMSILLGRCPALQVFRTCLPLSTGQHAGQRQFRSHPLPPPTAQRLSSRDGSSDSACQTPSQATGAHNLHLHCGPPFVPSSPSDTTRQLLTIPSQTASWNASTAV